MWQRVSTDLECGKKCFAGGVEIFAAEGFTLGESIAVDGACLTVVERGGELFRVQASPETLRRTTLGERRAGDKVNLERALQLGDRLGGHLVLGHVDAVGQVLEARAEQGAWVMAVSLPRELAPFFIDKGSVTLDGVSLTVNSVGPDRFSVMLIPETQARTTLLEKRVLLQGFIILDHYASRFEAFRRDMGEWVAKGQVKLREDVVDGLENAPAAFIGLLAGKNFGKLVVRLAG